MVYKMIDTRTDFILQLLQKLGTPLMLAVNRHPSADPAADAKTMAALLSESVKISISLSQAMNLKEQDGNQDAIRVSLATLAAGLVGDFYSQHGRIPTDGDVNKITSSLQSVIVFADNFAPAAEHAKRLKTLDGTPPFFDAVQADIYAIHALLPAMAAIAEFSFGQQETKLLQEVAEKLRGEAKAFLAKSKAPSDDMGELVVLSALSQIYAGAHRAQIQTLKNTGSEGGMASMADIWMSFGKQVAMLDVLMGGVLGDGSGSAVTSGGGGKSPDIVVSSEQTPPAPPPEQTPPAAGASPMTFFKKK